MTKQDQRTIDTLIEVSQSLTGCIPAIVEPQRRLVAKKLSEAIEKLEKAYKELYADEPPLERAKHQRRVVAKELIQKIGVMSKEHEAHFKNCLAQLSDQINELEQAQPA